MTPDQIRFEADLKLPEYSQGEILGYWGRSFVNVNNEKGPIWPHSLFWISVPPMCSKKIERYYLRLELTNYNVQAPAGCFWDAINNKRLDNNLWPNVTGPFKSGFRSDVGEQFYAPWDRGGKAEWIEPNSAVSWKAGVWRVHNYLELMHEILNSENYHGTVGG